MQHYLRNQIKSVGWLLALCLSGTAAYAQQAVTGHVADADSKQPVIGATVKVKGTSRGTSTDVSGLFKITADPADTLIVTFIGYTPVRIPVNGQHDIEIALLADKKALDEVVVTALGIRKEVKRLGYAVQEVKGSDLIKAREPNPINGLVGKVAGLTVGASGELLGAPQVLLRGSSINLFVVDGVPINSDTWNISPDDIESYTVLKGATASALYGSRGLNGAIMITTKKGSKDKRGFSVEFNSSTMFDRGFNAIPKVQDEYGPGDHGKYAFVNGKGAGTNDGDYDIWGPKFEGQLIPQYDSPVDPVTGVRQGTPWIARGKDNLKRFLQTGVLSTNSIAVSSHTEKSDLRFSLSHSYQNSIVPKNNLNITNFNISAGHSFSDRLRLDAYLNYNRQYTPNFPDVQYGPNSMIYNMVIWSGADWNVDDMRNYWQPGKEGIQSLFAEYQRYQNPWFMVNEWKRGHYKTDVNGYAKLSYKLSNHLDLLARTQVTSYDLLRTEKVPYSAHPYGMEDGLGNYREDKRTMFENNTDLLLTYNNTFTGNISLRASVGGNARSFSYKSSFVTTDYLNVPGLYTFSNSLNPLKASNFTSNMLVLSTYGYADVTFNKYATLSLTGRVDKLSTLPKGNDVYFYPSVSLSTVVSDYVRLPEVISMLKFRGSYANVKGGLTSPTIGATPQGSYPIGYGAEYQSSYDGPSFENFSGYSVQPVYDTKIGAKFTRTIANPQLKPFSSTAYEAGMDIRFLQNRIGLDVTYFVTKNGPRIYSLPVTDATGYEKILVNGVVTRKKGWEISLTGSPLRSSNGLNWDIMANWSTFKERYVSFYPGVNTINTYFKAGDRVDGFYGSTFVKTPDGQLIYDFAMQKNPDGTETRVSTGLPLKSPKDRFLGYTNPDWVWSINNSFRYKQFNFSFQFDGRVGGKMINYIQQQTYRGGRNIKTVQGAMGEARYNDYKGVKSWNGGGVWVSNGVPIQYDNDGNVTNYKDLVFSPNTTKTFLQDYVSVYYSTNEANMISKTFAKLREVVIGYTLPQRMLGRSFIRQANISFVGRNLLYFAANKDLDIDQYAGDQASSSLQTPATKRYGVNINLTF
ncbi:SusC/RagA family TonB-linked outer membrane protein [Chitinophaga pendula]|uniref:SusC/RagA family TonB-linked outer membrane protein n=1 Tax=Chitinophaga TaxID=79328 RepID=UPI000BAF1975|nr:MULTISPECIES: SusC/RagA family TonB-linked outer membrane protein [Chitinophaga]ASZ10706.1 SusC/RagA family TonB-linked outer membrane protein [Chitinophaga sp. MD30]UCJ06320.1 SusC/RagA family TonB-linked outer membrane protein [Chitinophaga pendula]